MSARPPLPPGFAWKDELLAGAGEARPAPVAPPAARPPLPPGFAWKEDLLAAAAAPPPPAAAAPPSSAAPAMMPPIGGTAPRPGSLAPQVMRPPNPLLAPSHSPVVPPQAPAMAPAHVPFVPPPPPSAEGPVGQFARAGALKFAQALPGLVTGGLRSGAETVDNARAALVDGLLELAEPAMEAVTAKQRENVEKQKEAFRQGLKWATLLSPLGPVAQPAARGVKALEDRFVKPWEEKVAGTPEVQRIDRKFKDNSLGELLTDPEAVGGGIGTAAASLVPMVLAPQQKGTRAAGYVIGAMMEAGGALRDIDRYEEETGKSLAPAKKAATVALTGAISGALERFGFEVATGQLAKFLPNRFRKGFMRAAAQAVQGAVGEIGTEESQTVAANLLQKLLVDPTREWNEGWKEAFIGAAGVGGGTGAVSGASRSMDVADRAKRMKAREQWRGEEAPWSLDAEDGGQPLPDDLAARRAAWQNERRAAPEVPASRGVDAELSRIKTQGQGLDAQLRSLQSEAGVDTSTAPARPPYRGQADEELRQLEAEAAVLNERIEALRRGEVPPAPRRPAAERPQPPHRPISVDQILGAQALEGVMRETTFRDQTAEARGRNVQTARANEERQRIANTPGEALRLILGDEPAFRPEPAPAAVEEPVAPGEAPTAPREERRRTPVPILDWIDERSADIDEDRRTAAPEEWTHDEARYFALTDPGTGLANRQAYEIGQKQTPAAVHAVLDVDGLKKVNDTFGHEVGDEYLSTVALVARQKGLRLFRVGGDEFTALHDGNEAEIQALLDGIRNDVEGSRVPVEGREEGAYPRHEGFSYGTGPDFKTADARAYEDKRGRKARRAAGAGPQVLPEPVGVGRGSRPEAPSGTRDSAGVPPPVRGRRDDGGASGAPPAGPASLPPPVTPPAPAAARPSAPEAAPTPPPNPPPSTSSFSRTGRDGEAFTADGERVGVQWAVADVFDDVVPSHTVTLEENPAFAQVLQPRNRERMASEQQVERMARAIRPAELGENYHASSGAPIVGPDRLVESGNGRTIALQRAYRMGRGEEYRTWLEEHAAKFGLTPEQVREVKSPVLVRVRTTPTENRGELVKKFNVATVAGMSDAETARSDSDRFTPELLAKFQPSDEGLSITAARNRPFVADFLKTVPENERAKMLDEDGQLSKGGISRIQNALLAKAYGRSPILERLTESTDDNIKQVSTALVNAAPAMATLRGAIEGGEILAELDPTPAIVEAAQKLAWLRDEGGTVESYLRQQGLFGDDMTSAGREALRAFDEFKRSGRKSTEFLTKLARSITLGGSAKQDSLFDDVSAPGLEEFVEAARRFVSDGGTGQLALEAGSSDPVPPETGRPGPEGVPPGEPSGPVDRPRVSLSRESGLLATDARRVMLVERFARNLSAAWKDAPRITVVPTEEGLPDELRALAEGSRVEGVYVPREDHVYLVAGSLRSREAVERVVLHEVMGHAGLRRLLGREQYRAVMEGIARSMPDEVRAKAEEYELDLTTPEGRQEAADEVLAEWASRGEPAPRPLARAVMTIRGWLRKLFPNLKWTPDEVRTLLAKARTRVERGTGERTSGTPARLSRGRMDWLEEDLAAGRAELHGEDVALYFHKDSDGFPAVSAIRRDNGLTVGEASFVYELVPKADETGLENGRLKGWNVEVAPEYRRRGVARAMYELASRREGKAIVPGDVLTPDGAAFRGKAGAPRFSRAQESTPAFREWFGDSKVVDEQGKPKVVYHGTNETFTEFLPETRGTNSGAPSAELGFFFAADPETAHAYARVEHRFEWEQPDPGTLSKQARREIDALSSRFKAWERQKVEGLGKTFGKKTLREFQATPEWVAANQNYFEERMRIDAAGRSPRGPKLLPVYLRITNPLTHDYGGLPYRDPSYATIIKQAKRERRDGVILRNTRDGAGQTTIYVAFRPEQIKSATGNTGAFSSENPDIRFSRTGATGPAQGQRRENVRRIYQALVDDVRQQSEDAARFSRSAREVWRSLENPDDILEARPEENLPEHSAQIQGQLRPAGNMNRVRAILNPLEALYQKTVRAHYAIEKASEKLGTRGGPAHSAAHQDPGVVAELAAGHAARAEQFLTGNGGFRLDDNGNVAWTGNRSMKDILAPLGPGRLNELRRYLVARRVIELHGREDSILAGIPEDVAQAEVDGAPEDIRQAAEQITALLDDALLYWADAGGLSPEALETIRQLNRSYVPFYRVFEGEDPVVGGTTAAGGRLVLPPERGAALQSEQPVKTILGSSRPILDPLVAAADHIQRMIRAADLNRVGTLLVEAAERNPDAAVGIIEEDAKNPGPGEGITREGRAVQDFAESLGVEVSDEAAAAVSLLSDKELIGTNDQIKVYRDGALMKYRVAPDIGESLRAMGPEEASLWRKVFSFPARMLRGGVTKNPLFQLHNFMRDSLDAGVQSRNGFVPILDSLVGFKKSLEDGSLRRAWLAAGGGYATISGGGLEGAERALRDIVPKRKAGSTLETLRHPLQALSRFGRPFEEAARLGEFRRAKLKGKTDTESALDAARVTTNFTVHGADRFFWAIARASAFSNPAMQGTDKFFRTVLEAPRGARQSPRRIASAAAATAFRGLAGISVFSALLYALNWDDDEIDELRKTKAGAVWWFLRVPGTKTIVRFPKPFAWGQIFGTGMETALDQARGADPKAMKRWRDEVIEVMTEGVFPVPTVVKTPFELAANKSLFFNRPIVPRSAEGLEPRLQAAPRTGETARRIGNALNVAPAKVEYAVGGIGGTLAREAMRGTDTLLRDRGTSPPSKKLSELPLVGRVFATPGSSGYSTETFYRELDRLREARKTYEAYRKQDPAKAREYLERHKDELNPGALRRHEAVAGRISNLRKEIEKVRKKPDVQMSPREKSDEIAKLEARMTALAAAAIGKPKKEPR